MKVTHRSFQTDAVIWDDTQAALDELHAIGLAVGGYHFEPSINDPRRTLVLHTAEGDRRVLPTWAVVKGATLPDGTETGFFSVPRDLYDYVYSEAGGS